MIIEFGQHSEPEIEFAQFYLPEEIELDDETAQIAGLIKVAGRARRSSEIARVTGNLSGSLKIACSRCLQLVLFESKVLFDVDFVTLENYGAVNKEAELSNADLSLSVYDGERISLDEIVREQILLNLPMHQLCSEECAGLCLSCGANKNVGSCDCETKEIDPRWSALKEFKKQ